VAVTAVTDYFSSSPLFFGRRVIDVQSVKTSAAHDRLVQKIALTAIVDQAHNSKRGRSCADPRTSRRLGRANFVTKAHYLAAYVEGGVALLNIL
jgi:hypothetical protein